MSLEPSDLELINALVYKNSDDIAVSIARSFERLEERIDSVEARTFSRMAEIEDKIEACRQDISDTIGELKGDIIDMRHEKSIFEQPSLVETD